MKKILMVVVAILLSVSEIKAEDAVSRGVSRGIAEGAINLHRAEMGLPPITLDQTGAIMGLIGKVDASNNLYVKAVAAGATGDTRAIGTLQGKVDASNNLYVTLAGGVVSGITSLSIAQGTLTADAQGITQTATWNNAGVTFIGDSRVFTETASAAASRYLQILGGAAGTTEEMYVQKGGTLFVATGLSVNGATLTQSGGGATMIVGPQGVALEMASRVKINPTAAGTLAIGNSGGTTIATLTVPTGTTSIIPVTQPGRVTAQNAAVASVAALTVGATDTTYDVSANVLVTTATTHNFTVTCAYTDEGNTARTATLTFRLIASPTTLTTAIANGNGAVPYQGDLLHIRAKAATTITIATTGTFTTVTYNAEGIIRKVS